MGWSGNATIGYKAEGENFMNNAFSGNEARQVACQNYSSNTTWTNIIYKLSKIKTTVEPLYKDTSETRTSPLSGHYAWSQLHKEVYKTTPEMKRTPLIRTL